jgi:riboflavin biosynthesis pyrimidine reductase
VSASLPRLQTLIDTVAGRALPLPEALREAYGGDLAFPIPPGPGTHLVANFVTTIDGLASFGTAGATSARHISRGHPGDRFVMGLLRAVADLVISGAGTLRVEPKVTWAAQQIFPAGADLYREARRTLSLPERTRVAILTTSGDVDLTAAVFRSAEVEPFIVTSVEGAARLAGRVPAEVRVVAVGERPTVREAIEGLTEMLGARLVLSEAGPHLFGRMLRERAVDELFLTVAPQIAGRSAARPGIGLAEEAFTPETAPWASLISAKRSEDYLLLRYGFRG